MVTVFNFTFEVEYSSPKDMSLTESDIDSFIVLYQNIYKEKLSRQTATEQANALLVIIKLTFEPMTRQERKKYYRTLKN